MDSDWLNKEQMGRENWLDSSFRMWLLIPFGPGFTNFASLKD